ncbi:MAG: DUF120 domain-containing protein [Euryarchaeota archaeon]|nr:DUF120 domain-containing protein [Euryarchaeota archaeon]
MTTSPEERELLKQLARLGGMRGFVSISSGELAGICNTSQQTASRKILKLLKDGLISRRMGTRKQLLRISRQGVQVLRREFSEYKGLFSGEGALMFKGRVTTGLGEGQYYMSRKGYIDAFERLVGFTPFPGTLNLTVDFPENEKLAELGESESLLIGEFTAEGRTFGAVKVYRASISAVDCAVIMPVRSHHANTIEVVAPVKLREKLDLKDGEMIDVAVQVPAQ